MQPVGILAALASVILLSAQNDLVESGLNDWEHSGGVRTLALAFTSCWVAAAVTTANQAIAIATTRDRSFARNSSKLRARLLVVFIAVVICIGLCSATLMCNAIRIALS